MEDADKNLFHQENKPIKRTALEEDRKALAREIVERIRVLAESKGIDAETAIFDCGLHRYFLRHMSYRGSIPAVDSFIPIADYFNVTLDYLFGRPPRVQEYGNAFRGIEDALVKSGVVDSPMSPAVKSMFYEYLAEQAKLFVKIAPSENDEPIGAYDKPATSESNESAPVDLDSVSQRTEDKKALAREIAERIMALAKAKGVTVNSFLIAMGYNRNFVSNMINHGTMSAADAFFPFADYFDVSLDFLLGRPKKDVEYPGLLVSFEDLLNRMGLTDKSFKPREKKLFFEFFESQASDFLSVNLEDKSLLYNFLQNQKAAFLSVRPEDRTSFLEFQENQTKSFLRVKSGNDSTTDN